MWPSSWPTSHSGADINASDAWGPPLSVAVARGSLEIVELLLDHGADIEGATSFGSGGLHPLHIATSSMKGPKIVVY